MTLALRCLLGHSAHSDQSSCPSADINRRVTFEGAFIRHLVAIGIHSVHLDCFRTQGYSYADAWTNMSHSHTRSFSCPRKQRLILTSLCCQICDFEHAPLPHKGGLLNDKPGLKSILATLRQRLDHVPLTEAGSVPLLPIDKHQISQAASRDLTKWPFGCRIYGL